MTSPQITDLATDPSQPPAQNQPQQVPGQEATPDSPRKGTADEQQKQVGLREELKKELLSIRSRYKTEWLPVRRHVVQYCSKKMEFIKGNHFIAFDPYSSNWFNVGSLGGVSTSLNPATSDDDPYRYVTNAYGAFETTAEAILAAKVPLTRFMPQDADQQEDIDISKSASLLQKKIEQDNDPKAMQEKAVLYMWVGPGYYRYTRYIVDADRAGVHQEPIVQMQPQEISPDRYVCPNCGAETPEAGMSRLAGMSCPQCGSPLSGKDFYPAEQMDLPAVVGMDEVANGMTAQTLYNILYVEHSPNAESPRESPIWDLQEEADIAYLRSAYPDMWEQIGKGKGSIGNVEGDIDRLARQMVYSAQEGRNNLPLVDMPTLSRCWFQPEAFDKCEKKDIAAELKQLFPKGCKMVSLSGDTVLEVVPEKVTDHWTMCLTKAGYGVMAPGIGDAALSLQERLDDVMGIQHRHMDRAASFTILGNVDLVDSKALDGKVIRSDVITPVKVKNQGPSASMESAFFQPKITLDAAIYAYSDKLLFLMQLLTGITPQTWGGAQQDLGDTFGAQEQAKNMALGKLDLFWQKMRREYAKAAEIAVRIEANALKALNKDLPIPSQKDSGDYENKFVRIAELRGNFKAIPEADQAFPMSFGEERDAVMQLLGFAAKNPEIFAPFLSEPTNLELIKLRVMPEGAVVPGEDERSRILGMCDQLSKETPMPAQDPMTGQMSLKPSVQLIPDLDDPAIVVATVKHFLLKNLDMQQENPAGWANCLALMQSASEMQKLAQLRAAMAQMPPPEAEGKPPSKPN